MRVTMSVEQVHQRLGVAEGVVRELQDILQRETTGHQAAHEAPQSLNQGINVLRGENPIRGHVPGWWSRRVLMPDRFGQKRGASWRSWSYLARDVAGVCACNAETSNEECKKKGAANFRVQPPSLRRDDRSGPRVATVLGFKDGGRSSGSISWS